MSDQEKIDKQVREVLGGFGVAPPARAWQNLEKTLDKRKGAGPFVLIFIGLMAISVIGTAYYFLHSHTAANTSVAADKTKNEKQISYNAQPTTPNKTNPILNENDNKLEKASNTSIKNDGQKGDNYKYHAKGNHILNQNGAAHKQTHLVSDMNPVLTEKTDKKQDKTDINEDKADILENGDNSKLTESPEYMKYVFLKMNDIDSKNADIKAKQTLFGTSKKSKTHPLSPIHFQLGLVADLGLSSDQRLISNLGLVGSTAAINDLTSTSDYKIRDTNVYSASYGKLKTYNVTETYKCSSAHRSSFGFLAGFTFGPHVSLETGLQYEEINLAYQFSGFTVTPRDSNQAEDYSPNRSEIDYSYAFLKVPLSLQYSGNIYGRLGWYGQIGGAMNILEIVQKGTHISFFQKATESLALIDTSYKNASLNTAPASTPPPTGYVSFSWQIGAGVSFLFSPKLSINAGMSFNTMINGISGQDVKPFSGFSIPIRLYYRF